MRVQITIPFVLGFILHILLPLQGFSFEHNFIYHKNISFATYKISLYFLEEKAIQNNPLLKDKLTEIKILQESLKNFKYENSGSTTLGLTYYPSSSYAENIIGYRYGFSARLRFPLSGAYENNKFKENQLKALIYVKKAEFEQLKNKVLFNLRKTFVNYYYTYKVEGELRNAINRLQRIKELLEERYRMRFALLTDVLTVDTMITKLRASLASIYETRLKNLAQIRSITADPYLPEFIPQMDYSDRLLTNIYLPPPNELIKFAEEHRKDIEFQRKAYETLENAVQDFSSAYPKAWVNVLGFMSSQDLNTFDSGVGFSLDLSFPWKKSQAEKALMAERKLRSNREKVRIKIEKINLITSIQNAISTFNIYRTKYLAFKKEYETSKKRTENLKMRLKAGLYGGIDGLIKLTSLINEEVGSYNLMMNSLKNMYINYFALLNALGIRQIPWIIQEPPTNYISSPQPYSQPTSLLFFSYVWNTEHFLSNPFSERAFIEECKSLGLDGIYLSLNGKQISKFLKNSQGMQKLLNFLTLAKSKDLSVQLLLGENSWIYPENREKLLRVVKLFNNFNNFAGADGFDGLHLDIEPHSLPDWKIRRNDLVRMYLSTLVQVKEVSKKPIIVDIPPNYIQIVLNGESLADKVLKISDGINVMAYFTNIDFLKRISSIYSKLGTFYGKPVTISLSVERILDDNHSFFNRNLYDLQRAIKTIENNGINSIAFQNFQCLSEYLRGKSLKTLLIEPETAITTTELKSNPISAQIENVELIFLDPSLPKEIIIRSLK